MATKNTSVLDFEVSVHADFSSFLKRTETFLLRNEAMNNLLWEVGCALDGTGSEGAWFGTVERAGKVYLAAVRGSARYLILARGKRMPSRPWLNSLEKKMWVYREQQVLQAR
tara:strand:- start:129 stop:464 length:336 start_codon:yes stop_codon:yes gene_type:complete